MPGNVELKSKEMQRKRKRNRVTKKSKKPQERGIYLNYETSNDFPTDKIGRPIVCKEVGEEKSTFNAMSSHNGNGKKRIFSDDVEGDFRLKKSGTFLNVEEDYEISNRAKKKKKGRFLGTFKKRKK